MFVGEVKGGNAIVPYRILARGEFHTEFAAALFARLECQALIDAGRKPIETYWVYRQETEQ